MAPATIIVMPNFEAADLVLPQQRQQSVVGVRTHAKFVLIGAGRRGRIVEDAEEYRRIARVAFEEIIRPEAQTGANSAQQSWPTAVTSSI